MASSEAIVVAELGAPSIDERRMIVLKPFVTKAYKQRVKAKAVGEDPCNTPDYVLHKARVAHGRNMLELSNVDDLRRRSKLNASMVRLQAEDYMGQRLDTLLVESDNDSESDASDGGAGVGSRGLGQGTAGAAAAAAAAATATTTIGSDDDDDDNGSDAPPILMIHSSSDDEDEAAADDDASSAAVAAAVAAATAAAAAAAVAVATVATVGTYRLSLQEDKGWSPQVPQLPPVAVAGAGAGASTAGAAEAPSTAAENHRVDNLMSQLRQFGRPTAATSQLNGAGFGSGAGGGDSSVRGGLLGLMQQSDYSVREGRHSLPPQPQPLPFPGKEPLPRPAASSGVSAPELPAMGLRFADARSPMPAALAPDAFGRNSGSEAAGIGGGIGGGGGMANGGGEIVGCGGGITGGGYPSTRREYTVRRSRTSSSLSGGTSYSGVPANEPPQRGVNVVSLARTGGVPGSYTIGGGAGDASGGTDVLAGRTFRRESMSTADPPRPGIDSSVRYTTGPARLGDKFSPVHRRPSHAALASSTTGMMPVTASAAAAGYRAGDASARGAQRAAATLGEPPVRQGNTAGGAHSSRAVALMMPPAGAADGEAVATLLPELLSSNSVTAAALFRAITGADAVGRSQLDGPDKSFRSMRGSQLLQQLPSPQAGTGAATGASDGLLPSRPHRISSSYVEMSVQRSLVSSTTGATKLPRIGTSFTAGAGLGAGLADLDYTRMPRDDTMSGHLVGGRKAARRGAVRRSTGDASEEPGLVSKVKGLFNILKR